MAGDYYHAYQPPVDSSKQNDWIDISLLAAKKYHFNTVLRNA